MKKVTFIEIIKKKISSIGWVLFIWGQGISKEEYWQRIYEQEKKYQESQK